MGDAELYGKYKLSSVVELCQVRRCRFWIRLIKSAPVDLMHLIASTSKGGWCAQVTEDLTVVRSCMHELDLTYLPEQAPLKWAELAASQAPYLKG